MHFGRKKDLCHNSEPDNTSNTVLDYKKWRKCSQIFFEVESIHSQLSNALSITILSCLDRIIV